MIRKVSELYPMPMMVDEMLRLANLDRNWLDVAMAEDGAYSAKPKFKTWLSKLWASGADAFGMLAIATWLHDGPKMFRPTRQQCEALEQIEVRLQLYEYSQPYPALLVEFPDDRYYPFRSCLCYRSDDGTLVVCCLNSDELHSRDIVTTIRVDDWPMEVSLQHYDESCSEDGPIAGRALRVAVNACLALANYGAQHEVLNKKDHDRDQHLAREDSERGKRAKGRLKAELRLVTFAQDVKLHRTRSEGAEREPSPTGRERDFGWVRGHWKMQAHGPGNSLRKRILIKPYMVRADKLTVAMSETSVEYRG